MIRSFLIISLCYAGTSYGEIMLSGGFVVGKESYKSYIPVDIAPYLKVSDFIYRKIVNGNGIGVQNSITTQRDLSKGKISENLHITKNNEAKEFLVVIHCILYVFALLPPLTALAFYRNEFSEFIKFKYSTHMAADTRARLGIVDEENEDEVLRNETSINWTLENMKGQIKLVREWPEKLQFRFMIHSILFCVSLLAISMLAIMAQKQAYGWKDKLTRVEADIVNVNKDALIDLEVVKNATRTLKNEHFIPEEYRRLLNKIKKDLHYTPSDDVINTTKRISDIASILSKSNIGMSIECYNLTLGVLKILDPETEKLQNNLTTSLFEPTLKSYVDRMITKYGKFYNTPQVMDKLVHLDKIAIITQIEIIAKGLMNKDDVYKFRKLIDNMNTIAAEQPIGIFTKILVFLFSNYVIMIVAGLGLNKMNKLLHPPFVLLVLSILNSLLATIMITISYSSSHSDYYPLAYLHSRIFEDSRHDPFLNFMQREFPSITIDENNKLYTTSEDLPFKFVYMSHFRKCKKNETYIDAMRKWMIRGSKYVNMKKEIEEIGDDGWFTVDMFGEAVLSEIKKCINTEKFENSARELKEIVIRLLGNALFYHKTPNEITSMRHYIVEAALVALDKHSRKMEKIHLASREAILPCSVVHEKFNHFRHVMYHHIISPIGSFWVYHALLALGISLYSFYLLYIGFKWIGYRDMFKVWFKNECSRRKMQEFVFSGTDEVVEIVRPFWWTDDVYRMRLDRKHRHDAIRKDAVEDEKFWQKQQGLTGGFEEKDQEAKPINEKQTKADSNDNSMLKGDRKDIEGDE